MIIGYAVIQLPDTALSVYIYAKKLWLKKFSIESNGAIAIVKSTKNFKNDIDDVTHISSHPSVNICLQNVPIEYPNFVDHGREMSLENWKIMVRTMHELKKDMSAMKRCFHRETEKKSYGLNLV